MCYVTVFFCHCIFLFYCEMTSELLENAIINHLVRPPFFQMICATIWNIGGFANVRHVSRGKPRFLPSILNQLA